MGSNEKKEASLLRAMPRNNEAEKAVLGACLIDNGVIDQVAARLTSGDFYDTTNSRIFQVIVGMWKLGHPVDQVTLVDTLLETGKLEDAGGPAYVAGLASETATSKNVGAYIEILLKNATRRGVIILGQQMAEGDQIDDQTIDGYQARLDQLLEKGRGFNREYAPIKEESLSDWDDVELREWLIDQLLPANELTLFTGRGGVGKSRLMLQIVGKLACGWGGTPWQSKERQPTYANNQSKKRIYLASWEDDKDEHKRRLALAQSRLGWFSQSDFEANVKYVNLRTDGRGPLWGVRQGENRYNRAHILPVGEVLLKQAAAFGADVLVLDPLSGAFSSDENDRASVREFTNYFSAWGNANNCAVLFLAHPPKNEAKFSGSTGWEADPRAMWFLGKDGKQDDQDVPPRYKFEVEKLSYAAKPKRPTWLDFDRGVWIEKDSIAGAETDDYDVV